MATSEIEQIQKRLTCPQLPLAVYREVAAHLRQVEGVSTEIIMRSLEHDESEKFDYYQSQVAALQINHAAALDRLALSQIETILDYYAQRYQPWQDYD